MITIIYSHITIPIGLACFYIAWHNRKNNQVHKSEDTLIQRDESLLDCSNIFDESKLIESLNPSASDSRPYHENFYTILLIGLGLGSILFGLKDWLTYSEHLAKLVFFATVIISQIYLIWANRRDKLLLQQQNEKQIRDKKLKDDAKAIQK